MEVKWKAQSCDAGHICVTLYLDGPAVGRRVDRSNKMSIRRQALNAISRGFGRIGFVLSAVLWLQACVVNPVTGQRELALVSSQQEIAIGREQYAPAQQMQGGTYTTDPGLTAYVNRVGQRVAAASGVDLPYEFVVLNNSVPNAWALPGGKIAINRGLLTELRNEAELAAVLGHEVAHAAARHGAKRLERGIVAQAVMVGVAIGTSGQDYAREAVGGATLAAGLLNQKYSRDAEREADFYGTRFLADAGYDPYAAVTLQETFVRLSGERRTDWIQGLFASHPASTERVSNNRQLLRQLRGEGFTGGELNQPAYAAALATITENAPAYAAYDEAQALYADDNYDAALTKVSEALGLYSEEAQFHGLRGAIRYQQGRYGDAVTNFDRAVARDRNYFFYYLNRGLALRKDGETTRAKADLTQSVRLLPTATAYRSLGEIAEAEGNEEAARRYYAQASDGQGAEATAARSSLVRLELPRQPAKYVQTRLRRDERGRYVLQVRNAAHVPVADVKVQIELRTEQGVRSTTTTVARVGAGETRLTLLQVDPEQILEARAYPVGAKVAK